MLTIEIYLPSRNHLLLKLFSEHFMFSLCSEDLEITFAIEVTPNNF